MLNSLDPEVLERSAVDLKYQARFLDAIQLDSSHKITLHIGGVCGDKEQVMMRFIENYQKLDKDIQKRLIIENDERQYTVAEVLFVAKKASIPVVFDNLHHECNPDPSKSEMEWLMEVRKTWKSDDGRQKIHYAQQDPDKRLAAHSQTIDLDKFNEFYQRMPTQEIDIMFEVKDKSLSALKGITLLAAPEIEFLEKEWSCYKYLVLEYSPKIQSKIEKLLEGTAGYPVIAFYHLIDEALAMMIELAQAIKTAEVIREEINHFANDRIETKFMKEIAKIRKGGSTRGVKRLLWKFVQEIEDDQLVKSLYFDEVY